MNIHNINYLMIFTTDISLQSLLRIHLIVNTSIFIPVISNNFFCVQAFWWSEGQQDRAVPSLDKCTHKVKLFAAHQYLLYIETPQN